ncbi:sulfatase-like hydrolase/transferase [uncultured Draconibacterium sp.]|uniref:sulfatase-like hydrolase/transferase n=1 Tax=uncultured Draconibacterium sp. TaxID=1573823 RepID=UPI0025CC009B|nr:sulfatase-like hydrolase/transferase [uncultured Draconibacterium sp.]
MNITFLKSKILLLCCIISFLGACKVANKENTKQPNILFLFTDDQRYGTIGEMQHDPVQTPNIDRLVKSGVTFTNSYILGAPHGAVCSPSRAMLMTGRHYFNLPANVYAQWTVPASERGKCDFITFPEHFKNNGYQTFATGKQHNGTPWLERGFDHCKSVYLGGMTKHFGTLVKDFEPASGWSEPYSDKEKFSSEVFADAAIDFIQHSTGEKPFLMYVAFTAPHDPRTAPEAFHKMYPAEEMELPANFKPGHPFPIADMHIRDEKLAAFPRTADEIKKHISDYYAMITATDVQIGRILDELEKSGKAENTIIVFSGDNGLAVGQHGLLGKQNLYEHSIKVPLIFCGPGIPEDQKREALVYLHDVFPTLCALTNLEIPESIQTKDISPVIHNEKEKVHDALQFAYNAWPGDVKREKEGQPSDRGANRAVRKGEWKLIISSKEGIETQQLFNLKDDPWELNNLVNEKAYTAIKEELIAELRELISETGDPANLDKDEFGLYNE